MYPDSPVSYAKAILPSNKDCPPNQREQRKQKNNKKAKKKKNNIMSLPIGASPRPALDLGLSRVARALAALGHPEASFAAVHVAGTNGKGSVCALVEAALRAARPPLRVGRFVSPFLCEPRDAVWVGGAPVGAAEWDAALARVMLAAAGVGGATSSALAAAAAAGAAATEETLTTFELWTAAAFLLFREARVDVAVVEVGVGGRGDATNVLPTPAVAVITNVGMDHVELLGPSLADIAAHKAGIIKAPREGATSGGAAVAVLAPGQAPEAAAIVRQCAAEVGAELLEARALAWLEGADGGSGARSGAADLPYSRLAVEQPASPAATADAAAPLQLRMPLRGSFQLLNGGAALAALRALQADPRRRFAALTDEAIATGFATAAWPGRLEVLRLRVAAAASDAAAPSAPAAGGGGGGAAADGGSGSGGTLVSVLVDGGHNENALPFVREAIDELLASRSGAGIVHFVYACSASRPLSAALRLLLRPGDRLTAVPFSPPEGMAWVRAHAPEAVVAVAAGLLGPAGRARAAASLAEALPDLAAAERDGCLCVVCGSLYLVADLYRSGCLDGKTPP